MSSHSAASLSSRDQEKETEKESVKEEAVDVPVMTVTVAEEVTHVTCVHCFSLSNINLFFLQSYLINIGYCFNNII